MEEGSYLNSYHHIITVVPPLRSFKLNHNVPFEQKGGPDNWDVHNIFRVFTAVVKYKTYSMMSSLNHY